MLTHPKAGQRPITVRGVVRWAIPLGVLAGMGVASSAAPAASAADAPWLYYTRHPGGATCGAAELWRGRLDGSGRERISSRALEPRGFDVSRDGRLVVWSVRGDLYILDIADGTLRPLVRTPDTSEQEPRLSPDGSTVAFIADRRGEGAGDLRVIPIAGGRARTLVSGSLRSPSWSPSGAKVAVVDLLRSNFLFTVSVRTGLSTRIVPNRLGGVLSAYFPQSGTVDWTRLGLLHSVLFNFNSAAGGKHGGEPPTGVYLTKRPVALKGRLLLRFGFDVANIDDPGYVGLTPDRKHLIVTRAGTGVRGGAPLLVGPLTGPLRRAPLGRDVSTPRFALGSPSAILIPPPPPGTPEVLCGGPS